MQNQRLNYLFDQYQTSKLSEAEELEWLDILIDPHFQDDVYDLTQRIFERQDLLKYQMTDSLATDTLKYILEQPRKTIRYRIHYRRLAAVAAVFCVIFSGIFFLTNQDSKLSKNIPLHATKIIPGRISATLTLANGKKILLNNTAKGEIAKEAGITIIKTPSGEVIYQVNSTSDVNDGVNTLSTAKGETYAVVLPDHSKVWLNALSSLTYNTNLTKQNSRNVKLIGEAYFEVAKDKAHPFVVESRDQSIQVLGTHFNIDSYADEPVVTTTLLEGAVKLIPRTNGLNPVVLKPGQKSTLSGKNFTISIVDVDDEIAWKDGQFVFNNEGLEAIMREVSRWYNVDVIYDNDSLKKELFWGSISRFEKVTDVLHMLEVTGSAKFKVSGRSITVTTK